MTASVIVDQTRLGGNARPTVGTISDMYAQLRLLFSRIGEPHVGTASFFSFNDPNGMCPKCSELGKVLEKVLRKVLLNINDSRVQGVVDALVQFLGS